MTALHFFTSIVLYLNNRFGVGLLFCSLCKTVVGLNESYWCILKQVKHYISHLLL